MKSLNIQYFYSPQIYKYVLVSETFNNFSFWNSSDKQTSFAAALFYIAPVHSSQLKEQHTCRSVCLEKH